MARIEKRIQDLEGRIGPPERSEKKSAKERIRAYLDEIAAAKREGREPSAEAAAVFGALRERLGRGA
jgi:hypothetical protein